MNCICDPRCQVRVAATAFRQKLKLVPLTALSFKMVVAGWLLEFYVLATPKVISGCVPTCDSVHSRWLYSAAPLGDQTASILTWYPTQTHCLDTEPTSPCPILMMQNTCRGVGRQEHLHKLELLLQWQQIPFWKPPMWHTFDVFMRLQLAAYIFSYTEDGKNMAERETIWCS